MDIYAVIGKGVKGKGIWEGLWHECVLSARAFWVGCVHGDALVPRAFSAVKHKFVPFGT
jgi:hypothetical protein